MTQFKFTLQYDDRELRRMLKNLRSLSSVEIRYGWWELKRYPRRHRSRGLPIAQIAYFNEFGTFSKGKRHIPPRPYLTQTGLMLRHLVKSEIVAYFKDAIYGKTFTTIALNSIPVKVHSAFEAIVGTGKALSQKTIDLKGSDEHWRETGRLLDNFQVKLVRPKRVI